MKKEKPVKKTVRRDSCAKYKMDILDYVTGDMTFITAQKQKALLIHVRKCPRCQQAYFEYENIHAAARTIGRAKNPAFKAKMDAMLETIKKKCANKGDKPPSCSDDKPDNKK
ncbi:MAG: hypothetical protein WC980_02260 [Candidatus Brocadiia bacterium]